MTNVSQRRWFTIVLLTGTFFSKICCGFAAAPSSDFATQVTQSPNYSVLSDRCGASHGLHLPTGSLVNLHHQLMQDQMVLAIAPPGDQFSDSLNLARVLLALTMGPEARGVLENATCNDPALQENLLRYRLLAIADVVSHRPSRFWQSGHDFKGGSKEMQFWHAAFLAEQGKTDVAAKIFAVRFPLIYGFSQPLQALLGPLVAEALIDGGQFAAAQSLVRALPTQRSLDLARAELLDAMNQRFAALAAYKKLQQGEDVRSAGIAMTRLIILRHKQKEITAKAAAEELSRIVFAWRGPYQELRVRIAIAGLFAEAGDWARAFDGLRHALIVLPSSAAALQEQRNQLFKKMVSSGALSRIGPLEAITAIRECEDLIPPGTDGVPILHALAQRLLALDLPDMAAPVLKELLDRVPSGLSRASLALALARVDLQSGHLKGAKVALAQMENSGLPPHLATTRALLVAEIKAKGGHLLEALKLLALSDDKRSIMLRTNLQLAAGDWKAAELTLRGRVATLKPSGILTSEGAVLVTQLATATSRAGDMPELAVLRRKYIRHMPLGTDGDFFDAITTPQIDPDATLAIALKQIASIERLRAAIPKSIKSSPDLR